jgi:L-2-hydroxyglutarate oxidase LhgO
METFAADVVVIGAGAVGLAAARAFALAGRDVTVVESAESVGSQTSSRNSEVAHAGFYYPPGSLKAQFCVSGRRALRAYCEARRINYRACGKLVVAVGEDEAAALGALMVKARANGVEDCRLLSPGEALALEPHINPALSGALYSGSSAIFDSHAYFLALQGEIEDAGGQIAFASSIRGGWVEPDRIVIDTGGASPIRLSARCVVNCAGHDALSLARRIHGPDCYPQLRMRWAKGNYFSISGRAAFSRLIYPMHGQSSVGLHLTVDLSGRMRVGPDVEWLDQDGPPFDYAVSPMRAGLFYEAVRRYWPGLPDGALTPDYAGVRPKLSGPDEASADFFIDEVVTGGAARLVHLIGIDSPGLTSSLAIGEFVASDPSRR